MTDVPPQVLRRAGRVVLVDELGQTLLLNGFDPGAPAAGSWWVTPGGGVEPGESTEQAARREVLEETGIVLGELGAVRLQRTATFTFEGVDYEQREDLWLAHITRSELDLSGWTPLERRSILGHRWWSLRELEGTAELIHPRRLAELLRDELGTAAPGR